MATSTVEVELPKELELATCDRCFTYTVTEDQEEAFEAAVRKSMIQLGVVPE